MFNYFIIDWISILTKSIFTPSRSSPLSFYGDLFYSPLFFLFQISKLNLLPHHTCLVELSLTCSCHLEVIPPTINHHSFISFVVTYIIFELVPILSFKIFRVIKGPKKWIKDQCYNPRLMVSWPKLGHQWPPSWTLVIPLLPSYPINLASYTSPKIKLCQTPLALVTKSSSFPLLNITSW
jgi:hypothetical protein